MSDGTQSSHGSDDDDDASSPKTPRSPTDDDDPMDVDDKENADRQKDDVRGTRSTSEAAASSSSSSSSSQRSKVRVGVRVRPLASDAERSILRCQERTVGVAAKRSFTYDHVWDSAGTQTDLYEQVRGDYLTAFVEGYNATIMAYGQTGSGKTYTMGSEAHTVQDFHDGTGLIPRFMKDLFEILREKQSERYQCHLQTSFLEVYGEDVHDLLSDDTSVTITVREDASGATVCSGLTWKDTDTAEDCLAALQQGTARRTTAATLMNGTSSRSHAIFTVALTQTTTATATSADDTAAGEVTTVSRFTFVDLAGSERMKKTGAEGERAREGIKINEGLLALGNVINALADNETSTRSRHVPYRQSKLTRLLQDALGGNSQTLFVACVSPADCHASETLSTLHYANRARNIQNAVSRNVNDPAAAQVQRLSAYVSVLQAELVQQKFGDSKPVEEWMKEKDVNEYLDQLQAKAQERMSTSKQFPVQTFTSPRRRKGPPLHQQQGTPIQTGGTPLSKTLLEEPLAEVNPDEDMAILDHLLDLQQHEETFDAEQKRDHAALKQVEGELAEQEVLLLQLRESLKNYRNMKAQYDALMTEVQRLESDKAHLAEQLEKANADPTKGCSAAIRRELQTVERNLARARDDARQQRQRYRKAEQEAAKAKVMERKVEDLKAAKARLIKKQKEATARHREYTEAKTREIAALKRKERKAAQQMTKLQTEVAHHKRNLEKRQAYCQKLSGKLQQTEQHLMKLLSLRQRDLRSRTGTHPKPKNAASKQAPKQPEGSFADSSSQDVQSLQFLLDKAVQEKVSHASAKNQYEERMAEYSEAMRSLVETVQQGGGKDWEHAIEKLELRVDLSAAELESLRGRLSPAEDRTQQLLQDKTAPVVRTLLLNMMERLSEAELDRSQLKTAMERKESVLRSFETEIESLNHRIVGLTKNMAQRQSMSEDSALDSADVMERLQKERDSLATKLEESEQEVILLRLFAESLEKDYRSVESLLSESREKLTLAELTRKQNNGDLHPSEEVVQKMQAIWNDLGVSAAVREDTRRQIENCLEDTCTSKLEEAVQLKSNTESEVSKLRRDIESMCASLEVETETAVAGSTLLDQLKSLQQTKLQLKPAFDSAIARRQSIVQQVNKLTSAMGFSKNSVTSDLQTLLEEASKSDENESTTEHLDDAFLSRCDREVTALRIQKSKILTDNASLQKATLALVSEMYVDEPNILPLVIHSIEQRSGPSLPEWWNNEIAEQVARAVTTMGGVVRCSNVFSKHLAAVHEALESIAARRRLLSTKLRDLVERAQKTLLATVDGEVDASEAYSSFHDLLLRFPALSKERIHACMTEIEALTSGVDAMTQSEIEALAVVWEALNVSASDRGNFWGDIDDSVRQMQATPEGPFDEIVQLSAADGEEWVLTAVRDGTKSYRLLESRLFKLEKIHQEVERLRSRQDAKSKIISLDSEVRILSAKLSEFEDQKCSKQRLTTKKNTSSNLLKEERFRKQMQAKFTSKLDQLESLLKAWKTSEGSNFDPNLLSDDVRTLLRKRDRNEFMHLRTVEYKGTGKRAPDSSSREKGSTPPPKRHAKATRAVPSRATERPSRRPMEKPSGRPSPLRQINKRKREERHQSPAKIPRTSRIQAPSPSQRVTRLRSRQTDNSKSPFSPTRNSQADRKTPLPEATKRPSLNPFGSILGQAQTPAKTDKENPEGSEGQTPLHT